MTSLLSTCPTWESSKTTMSTLVPLSLPNLRDWRMGSSKRPWRWSKRDSLTCRTCLSLALSGQNSRIKSPRSLKYRSRRAARSHLSRSCAPRRAARVPCSRPVPIPPATSQLAEPALASSLNPASTCHGRCLLQPSNPMLFSSQSTTKITSSHLLINST